MPAGSDKMIHILTDTVIQQRWTHLQLAQMALEGGADVVQIRTKNDKLTPEEYSAIFSLQRKPNQKIILNDDVESANRFGADGAHVGREDMPVSAARKLLGDSKILGATVHSLAELENLRNSEVDYIGVGPVFGTSSKNTNLPALGLEGLREICEKSPWPVIAIGNVNLQNAAAVMKAGAAGVAVLSAFCLADDPVEVARQFRKILG